MTTRPIVKMSGIGKTYKSPNLKELKALDNIELAIQTGEFVLVMGPSGSGKSTLLFIMGCLEYPSEGSYSIGGETVDYSSDSRLSRMRADKIGFVFQDFNLFPHMTAVQNVAFPLLYHGTAAAARMKKAAALLDKLGMKDRSRHYPSQLSGGEQQRVAIARALITEPALLIADEPTGNLDEELGAAIMDTFKQLNSEGRTLVMATHNPDYKKYASRIIHLRNGRIHKQEIPS